MASTANAGFNVVLTALINSAFAAGAYHVLQSSVITPAAVGFLIGCSCMETALSLMTAVYWGQLSKCEITKLSISQYSCEDKVAYGAVSAFATLLFLIQTIFTGSLIGWNEDIIDEDLQVDSVTLSSTMLTSREGTGVRLDPSGSSSMYRDIPTTEDRSNDKEAEVEVVGVVDKELCEHSDRNSRSSPNNDQSNSVGVEVNDQGVQQIESHNDI